MRSKISEWMASLFDRNVLVEDVKKHVSVLTQRVVAAQLKFIKLTEQTFKNICKDIENELK